MKIINETGLLVGFLEVLSKYNKHVANHILRQFYSLQYLFTFKVKKITITISCIKMYMR